MIKIVFFGTHKFASIILQSLIDNPDITVARVFTQPDKPVGRHQELQHSPVKILAQKYNIPIDQPDNLKNYELRIIPIENNRGSSTLVGTDYKGTLIPTLRRDGLQLGIVAQYGLLIPKNVLEIPKFGTLNVHTSLLPKYRGASPIQSALINGGTETGISIIKMDTGFDTGPILLQKTLQIEPDDTYPILEEKLAQIGVQALAEAIPDYINGNLIPKPQDNSIATECHQLSRQDGEINWHKKANEIYNLYRGLIPWPGVWTTLHKKRLKLLAIKPADKKLEAGKVEVIENKIFIGCADKSIEVIQLQLEGKKPMTALEFLNGHKNINNEILT